HQQEGAALDTTPSTRSSAGLARWSPLGGILYVVLFVIGVIVMFDGEPGSDASPAKVIAYYSKSSHRDKIAIAWIIAGLGVIFFPQAASGIWILVVSGGMFIRGMRGQTRVPATPA